MTVTPASSGVSVRSRLSRIEGQAAGLRRMWAEGRSAEDVLDQIAAVRSALRGVAIAIVHESAEARLCVAPARAGDAERLDDVLALVDRVLRCR